MGNIGLPKFGCSPYLNFYYCRRCGKYYRHEEAEITENKVKLCPDCHTRLRIKPRRKRNTMQRI